MKTTADDIRILEDNLAELELRYGLEGAWPGADAQIQLERSVLAKAKDQLAGPPQSAVS